MWLINLIPLRLQYYGILVLVVIAGIFGIYWLGGQNKKKDIEVKLMKDKVKNINIAKEVADEVKSLDDGTLYNRASKWVRNNK
jgi:hypothetical protein